MGFVVQDPRTGVSPALEKRSDTFLLPFFLSSRELNTNFSLQKIVCLKFKKRGGDQVGSM